MIVDSPRHLVPLGDLDPVANVSLTDAGLTPYHAIKPSIPKLVPGSVAVVIGTGGLGHAGIQILRAMTNAAVVALEANEDKLQLAKDVGAHHVFLSNVDAIGEVKRLTHGLGAQAVFDFMGITPTMTLGPAMIRAEGDPVLVGIGSGTLPVGWLDNPTRPPSAACTGASGPNSSKSSTSPAPVPSTSKPRSSPWTTHPRAYEKLRLGELRGRAVIVP